MSEAVNTAPIDRLMARFTGLTTIDFTPLMEDWEVILHDDNREGLLAGLDGYGNPMAPVTYRPKPVIKVDYSILPNDNLTSSHYRSLMGPPLIPRGEQSRAIKNFRTAHGHDASGDSWKAIGAWEDVLSVSGIPFLPFHFRGEGNLPVRDLAHVRPSAMQKARQALRDFMQVILRRK